MAAISSGGLAGLFRCQTAKSLCIGVGLFAMTLSLTPSFAETPAEQVEGQIALRQSAEPVEAVQVAAAIPSQVLNDGKGKMQIEAQDPQTGKVVHIDISSDELTYVAGEDAYKVKGNVYIIIPEKQTEILADEATFNSKTSNMVAFGHVFIINKDKVLGSEQTRYDLANNLSYYTEPRTVTKDYRLSAKESERTEQYTVLKDGRLILSHFEFKQIGRSARIQRLMLGKGAMYSYYSANRSRLLLGQYLGDIITGADDPLNQDNSVLLTEDAKEAIQPKVLNKPISPRDVQNADYEGEDSKYIIKVKKVTVNRKPKGFDEITLKNVLLKYKNLPIGFIPSLEFGYNEDQNFMAYLGSDFGYNVDYGGWYWGPGLDTRLLNGWLKVSPTVSYGGGRRTNSAADKLEEIDNQPGVGVLAHYYSPTNLSEFSYNTTLDTPLFLMQQKLFGRQSNTRLRLSANQSYNAGFFDSERPSYMGELTDQRMFMLPGSLRLRTFAGAGVARDNFFPTRQRRFFVDPENADPITTSRFQLQAELRTQNPLVYLGKFGAIGALAQGRLAWYGTGDWFTVVQGGPFANFILGPTFTQVRYLYGETSGQTPFVFDSFYQGRNSLRTINSLDIGKHITIGAEHNFNLDRSNARKDLVVGQKIFLSAGSKNVRFSVAFDAIQRQSYFGITFNPEGGEVLTDFNQFNLYEPGYTPSAIPASAVLAPDRKKKKADPQS